MTGHRKPVAGAYWLIGLEPQNLNLRAGEMVRMELPEHLSQSITAWATTGANFLMRQPDPDSDGWLSTQCQVTVVDAEAPGPPMVRLEFKTLTAVVVGEVSTYFLVLDTSVRIVRG